MKREELSQAVGNIDTAYIQEADREDTHRKKQFLRPILGMAACLAVAVTAVFSLRTAHWDKPAGEEPQQATASAGEAQEPDCIPEDLPTETELPGDPVWSQGPPQFELINNPCMDTEDLVPMPDDVLLNYYGVTLPAQQLPPDLELREEPRGIFCREQGKGEVYSDSNQFAFTSTDGSRQAVFRFCKTEVSADAEAESDLKYNIYNGRRVTLFRDNEAASFWAEWMEDGVSCGLMTQNLTQEEFMTILSAAVTPL